jgi:hypothetical protein
MKKVSVALASIFAASSFSAVAAPTQMTETEMDKVVAGCGGCGNPELPGYGRLTAYANPGQADGAQCVDNLKTVNGRDVGGGRITADRMVN